MIFQYLNADPALGIYYHETDGRNTRVPLYYASSMGLENLVRLFLANGAKVNEELGTFGTALEVTVRRNHTEVIRMLLEGGADANLAKGLHHSCDTALNTAVRYGDISLVRLLLANGADMNFYNSKDMHTTALGVAV